MINFPEVPLPALCYGNCLLEEEFHSFVLFSSLMDHRSPGLPIVSMFEKIFSYSFLVVYGERS